MVGEHALMYSVLALAAGLLLLLTALSDTKRNRSGDLVKNDAFNKTGQVLGGAVLLMVGMMGAFYVVYAHFNP